MQQTIYEDTSTRIDNDYTNYTIIPKANNVSSVRNIEKTENTPLGTKSEIKTHCTLSMFTSSKQYPNLISVALKHTRKESQCVHKSLLNDFQKKK